MAIRWIICCLGLIGCGKGFETSVATETAGPLIIAAAASGDAVSLRSIGQNGAVTTWESRGGVQLVLDQGVLIATKGLGFDLMIADTGMLSALQRREVSYTRQFRHLDGEFVLGRITLFCITASRGARRLATLSGQVLVTEIAELCSDADRAIENTYAIAEDGRIWQSRQWVSDEIGYLEITLVRP